MTKTELKAKLLLEKRMDEYRQSLENTDSRDNFYWQIDFVLNETETLYKQLFGKLVKKE